MNQTELISVVIPVYNEAENIQPCLRGVAKALSGCQHEVLICYDFEKDSTLAAIRAMEDSIENIRLIKNTLGRGVAFALQAGFQAALGDVIVTTMADLSDPPENIPIMARKIRQEGADVVSGSRYMNGGSQTGGPLIKKTLSRLAGRTLHLIAGLPTWDPTTNFRAYSSRFLKAVPMESRNGFEVGLELTVKAHILGFRVDEVPSSWVDRSAGKSRFRLIKWLPKYLNWYFLAIRHRFTSSGSARAKS